MDFNTREDIEQDGQGSLCYEHGIGPSKEQYIGNREKFTRKFSGVYQEKNNRHCCRHSCLGVEADSTIRRERLVGCRRSFPRRYSSQIPRVPSNSFTKGNTSTNKVKKKDPLIQIERDSFDGHPYVLMRRSTGMSYHNRKSNSSRTISWSAKIREGLKRMFRRNRDEA